MTRPNWLRPPDNLDEGSLRYWNYYANGLWRAGKLTADNVENFKKLCRLLTLADTAGAEIGVAGIVAAANAGAKTRNPAVGVLLEAHRQTAPLLRQFGLDGNARAR